MSTYVLVHGAWHGAWCWYMVVPRLLRAGHIVIAPNLPSLGRDGKVSLDTWVDHICRIVDTASEPVVLVEHSRAGIIISEVAERRPEKIAVLVYLGAYLLRDGESLLPVAQRDGTSLEDNVIPVPFQRQMHATLPCRKVVSLNTDHSPFFSAPPQLTESLTALAVVGAA